MGILNLSIDEQFAQKNKFPFPYGNRKAQALAKQIGWSKIKIIFNLKPPSPLRSLPMPLYHHPSLPQIPDLSPRI